MASLVLTVQAAGWAFTLLGGTFAVPFTLLSITKPLVGAATAYFVFNTLLVATAIALSTRQPIVRVWNENFLWSAPSYFVGALAAARRRERHRSAAATGWRRSPRRRSI